MKVFVLALLFVTGAAQAANCEGVKKKNLALSQAIAADDDFAEKLFLSDFGAFEESELKGDAKDAYAAIEEDEEYRVLGTITFDASNTDLIVLGENLEGNGYYALYTMEGEYVNMQPFTESSSYDWACVGKKRR